MKINSINNYNLQNKRQNFAGKIFGVDATLKSANLPEHIKNTLQQMVKSIPSFTEAAQFTSKADLVKLAKMYSSAQTNVLELALKGKVKIATGNYGGLAVKDLFSLSDLIEFNKKAPDSERLSLYKAIKNKTLIKTVEQKALQTYPTDNMYPKYMKYVTEQPLGVSPTEFEDVSYSKHLREEFLNGKEIKDGDSVIIFEKPLHGKHDVSAQYSETPKALIGEPQSAMPENLKIAFKLPLQDKSLLASLYELSNIDYFNNIIGKTNLNNLFGLAKLNKDHDGLLVKMLNKELMFSSYNPTTQKISERPIIDIEKLVADKKYGLIPEDDFATMLYYRTLFFDIGKIYGDAMKKAKTGEVKKIVLDTRDGNLFEQVFVKPAQTEVKSVDDIMQELEDTEEVLKEYKRTIPYTNPKSARLLDFLTKFPQKYVWINF